MAGPVKTRFTRGQIRELVGLSRGGRSLRSLAKEWEVSADTLQRTLKAVDDRLDPEDDPVAVDRAVMGDWDSYDSLTFFERQTVAETIKRILDPMYPEEREQRIANYAEAWGYTSDYVYQLLGMWERGSGGVGKAAQKPKKETDPELSLLDYKIAVEREDLRGFARKASLCRPGSKSQEAHLRAVQKSQETLDTMFAIRAGLLQQAA